MSPRSFRPLTRKGKTIEIASTEQIEMLKDIAEDFMERVFDLESGDYAISDESDLRDFTDFRLGDTRTIWRRIKKLYSIDIEDVRSSRLVSIFTAIKRRRRQ